IVVPPGVRLDIHRRELPELAPVVDPALEPFRLLVRRHLQPVLEQVDPRVDHQLLDQRRDLEEPLHLLLAAEAHDALDPGAVVPPAAEDHVPARRWKVREVALRVHLRLLALGRRRQRDHPEDARADPFRDRLDRPALSGTVAALEHDADLESLALHPELKLHELGVQLLQLPLVLLALQRLGISLARALAMLSRGLRFLRIVWSLVSFHAALLALRHAPRGHASRATVLPGSQ